jgi:hypothetical protein
MPPEEGLVPVWRSFRFPGALSVVSALLGFQGTSVPIGGGNEGGNMRRLGRLGTAVLFVAGAAGVGIAAARAADPNDQAREAAPLGAQASAPVALLSRLHHAALREVQLGDLAEAAGSTPASRRYGAQLSGDFREVDQRIVATAASAGIDAAQLSAVQAGENVVALRRETDDFARLANERGPAFDRDFWVTVAQAQSAESDMLTTTAAREPALLGLVSDMSQLYDQSSRRALVAASTPQAPSGTANAPSPPAPEPPSDAPSSGPADGVSAHPPGR